MAVPPGSPDHPATALIGRHPRLCGSVLAAAGGGILWWQVVRPLLLLEAGQGEVVLSPVLAALGLLIGVVGLCYLVGGARVYAWLVVNKTPEKAARLRLIGLGLGAVSCGFYWWLEGALRAAGWQVSG